MEYESVNGVHVDGYRSSGGLCQHDTEFSVSIKLGNFLTSSRASKKKASFPCSLVSDAYQLVANGKTLSCLSQCEV
jgi:hypothetical protein